MSKIQGHCCQHIVTYIIRHKSLGTKISYKKGPMNIGTQIMKSNVDTRYIYGGIGCGVKNKQRLRLSFGECVHLLYR